MTNVMIIGAHGATAQILIEKLLSETDDQLVLFLRNAKRLARFENNPQITLIDGDILNTKDLAAAMKGVDVVYSNAGGIELAEYTTSIITAMGISNINRLIFLSAIGARYEVANAFGNWNEQAIADYLPGFRKSAKLLDNSDLVFTELRPSWLTNNDEVDYEIIALDDDFVDTEVSRKSVADLVFKIIKDPSMYENESIGVGKPGTIGDKPAWIK